MFQRRMIEVLSRRPNTQLSPNFKKGTKTKDPQVDDGGAPEDGEGGGGGGTAGFQNNSQTVRGTIDSQLQSLRNLNSKRYRKQLTRSGHLNVLDSVLELPKTRSGHLNVLDSVLELPKKHFSLKQFWKKHSMSISFILYIVLGTLFYSFDPGNRQSLIMGFYEAITIGYSVGLGPKDPDYEPNPWFSSAYILIGAALIAIILTSVGNAVEERSSIQMFEALKSREDYEAKMAKGQPICTRFGAFIHYYSVYLFIILLWLVWITFIIVWSMKSAAHFDFAKAQYFAFSVCSSAGSISLPYEAPEWAFLLAGISMFIGVPLMALAVSAIVVMLWQGHNYRKIKRAAWNPVLPQELKLLESLDIGVSSEDESTISKSGYILLGLLRMGQDGGIIKYLSDAYEEAESRGGVLLRDSTGGATNTKKTGLSSRLAAEYVAEESPGAGVSSEVVTNSNATRLSVLTLESISTGRTSLASSKAAMGWSTAGSVDAGSNRNMMGRLSSLTVDPDDVEGGQTGHKNLSPIGESMGNDADEEFLDNVG